MIYIVSDLHYGMSPKGDRSVQKLATYICRIAGSADMLCIAGDIGRNTATLKACLKLFADFQGLKCAIPGNHDVWVTNGTNSWDTFKLTSKIFKECGFHPLEDEPLITSEIAIAGTMGWYDYSFQDPSLKLSDTTYAQKQAPRISNAVWSDAQFVKWPYSDKEMAHMLAKKLAQHLASIPRHKKTLVITHHLPTKSLLLHPRWLIPKEWRFLNTYLGSELLQKVISLNPNVFCTVSGHVHMQRSISKQSQRYITVGGDYTKKQIVCLDGKKVTRLDFSP